MVIIISVILIDRNPRRMPMCPATKLFSGHTGSPVVAGLVQEPTERQPGYDKERAGFHPADVVDLADIDILGVRIRELAQAIASHE